MGGLFLLFTVVPLVELFLLVRVGAVVGALNTLALVLLTGLLGATLARREGLRVLRDWQHSLEQGRMPADGVLSGLLVLVGGVLLITPGILTDLVGLSLLLPPTRRAAARLMRAWMERQIEAGHVSVYTQRSGPFSPRSGPRSGPSARPRRPVDPRRGDVIDTFGEDVSS